MQLNREVLPAPFGPTSPKIWPGSTAKLTSCSTLMPPNCRLTSCKVSSAAIDRLSRRCHVASGCGPWPVEGTYGSPRRIVNDLGVKVAHSSSPTWVHPRVWSRPPGDGALCGSGTIGTVDPLAARQERADGNENILMTQEQHQ